MRFMMQARYVQALLVAGLTSALVVSCGGDEPGGDGNMAGGSASGGSSGTGINLSGGTPSVSGATSTGGTGSGGSSNNLPSQCTGELLAKGDDFTQCVGVEHEPEKLPGDLYFLMDSSISQTYPAGGTTTKRWEVLRGAVEAFLQQATSQGLDMRLGLGFFSGGNEDGTAQECNPGFYETPAVEIQPVGQASPLILNAIEQRQPGGLTPTRPALDGAHRYAARYAAQNPERATSVVLLTDGYPTSCEGKTLTFSPLKTIAENAQKANPRVRTFVVGLEGEQNLTQIARAGGTEKAYAVDLKKSADIKGVTDALVDVLKGITNTHAVCTFALPEPKEGEVLAPEKVQFRYTPEGGQTENLYKLTGAQDCRQHGGWFYADASQRVISVCDCNCNKFGSGVSGGKVDIRLGCDSILPPQ